MIITHGESEPSSSIVPRWFVFLTTSASNGERILVFHLLFYYHSHSVVEDDPNPTEKKITIYSIVIYEICLPPPGSDTVRYHMLMMKLD